jgi:hypothetical protein
MSEKPLVTQPTPKPTNKVIAGALTGVGATVVLVALDALSSASFDGAWWGAAVATGAATLAAYLRKNRAV